MSEPDAATITFHMRRVTNRDWTGKNQLAVPPPYPSSWPGGPRGTFSGYLHAYAVFTRWQGKNMIFANKR